MAKADLELVALALVSVTARLPGDTDGARYPVLGVDADFHGLPADDTDATADDTITQETVLALAAAAVRALRLPTKQMRMAGALRLASEPTEADCQKAAEVFRAIVDEVLRG